MSDPHPEEPTELPPPPEPRPDEQPREERAEPAPRAEEEEAEPERAGWPHRVAVGVVLLLAVAAGAWILLHHEAAPEGAQAQVSGDPIEVGVVEVQPRDVPLSTDFLAQTEPSRSVDLRARVSGTLLEAPFEEGQPVSEGDVLFRIDHEPYRVALREAQARLKSAEAQRGLRQRELERIQRISEAGGVSVDEVDDARQTLEVAEAAVQESEAAVERAQLNLGYTEVTSPIDGKVGRRAVDPGNYLNAAGGETRLATVQAVDPMFVRFSVSESDLLRWQRLEDAKKVNDVPADELEVAVVLPDDRVLPATGRINYVDVAVDPGTGTAVVRATVPNPNDTLLPGQFVTARVTGVVRLGALVVPKGSVSQTPGGSIVFVVDGEGLAATRPVDLGDWTDDGWIVEHGLSPGDRVIADSLTRVRPGVPVTAAAPDAAPADANPQAPAAAVAAPARG